ncbi:MAG: glycosyltransferase family 39 protein, partial [bacterium]|nr:glycosyltransferase family 39 protein [bacterium]
AVVVLYGIALGVLSQNRSIDGDEGYYASAARLVVEGASVYRDFFYPQMPLMPHVYSPAYAVHGSLASLRYLSVILSVATVFLWCLYLRKVYSGAPAVGWAALLLLVLNPGFGSWGVVVKTYALSNCLVTGVLLALYAGLRSGRWAWFAMGGLLGGVLVSVRLLYVAVPLVILVWLLARGRTVESVSFLVGAIVGALPAIWFFFLNPDAFVFNNFTYHSWRSDSPPLMDHVVYLARFFLKMLLARSYLALIFVLGLVGLLFSRGRLSGFHAVCAWTAAACMLGSTVPYPLYFQYFTAAMAPLLVPLTAAGLSIIGRRRAIFCWVVLGFALTVSSLEIFSEAHGDEGGSVWDLQAYGEISRYLRAHTEPEDVVLSFWPGYVFESGRRYFPGLENHFGLRIASGLSPEEHRRYR